MLPLLRRISAWFLFGRPHGISREERHLGIMGGKLKQRIIFITDSFQEISTGPGTYAKLLWDAFADDPGFDFHMVTLAPAPDHPKIHTVAKSRMPGKTYKALQRAAKGLMIDPASTLFHANAPQLAFDLLDLKATVAVQFNDYEGAVVVREARSIVREDGVRRLATLLWRRRKERKVYCRAQHLLFNSEACRQINEREYGARTGSAQVIYKSADIDTFTPPLELPDDPYPQRPAANRFMFVGSSWERKGLPLLLAALRLLQREGITCSLVVVGATEFPANRRILEQAHLQFGENQLIFASTRTASQIAEIMWHSDGFILPSRREALGVAIIEAMAASMVVIATAQGGIPELVQNKQNGLLIESEAASDLAKVIRNVCNDELLRERLKAKARQRAMNFHKSEMLRKVREFYQCIASTKIV